MVLQDIPIEYMHYAVGNEIVRICDLRIIDENVVTLQGHSNIIALERFDHSPVHEISGVVNPLEKTIIFDSQKFGLREIQNGGFGKRYSICG
jgi:hypothetical protein